MSCQSKYRNRLIAIQFFALAFGVSLTLGKTSELAGDEIRQISTFMVEGKDSRNGQNNSVQDVVFSPDSAILAAVISDGTTKLIEPRTGKVRATLEAKSSGRIQRVAFSPDGKSIATGGRDGKVTLWELSSWQIQATFQAVPEDVQGLAFSQDGQMLVAVGVQPKEREKGQDVTGLRVVHWDAKQSRTESSRVIGYSELMQLSHDGRILVTANSDYIGNVHDPDKFKVEVILWDTINGKVIASLPAFKSPVYALALSNDAKTLLTGDEKQSIQIWDVATAKKRSSFTDENSSEFPYMVFSPEGKVLAARGRWGETGVVRLFETSSGRELARTEIHKQAGLLRVAFSPDGKMLATVNSVITIRDGHAQAEIKVWDYSGLRIK